MLLLHSCSCSTDLHHSPDSSMVDISSLNDLLCCVLAIQVQLLETVRLFQVHTHCDGCAGIILPIIPVIICLKVDGYVLYLILPNCVPRNIQSAFYSYLLPMIIVVAIGLYLLVLIFWKYFSEVLYNKSQL